MKNSLLPHSREAEKCLLGAMIAQGYFDREVLLSADDFFSEAHRRIYLTMAELDDLEGHCDIVSLVGVDNDELMCELSATPLSSVALDLEKAGYEAAKLLDSLMFGQLAGGHIVHVEPVYIVSRQSTEVIVQDDAHRASALRFIRNHAAQLIGVPDVVEHLGVSRRTLERKFSRALGRSIAAEITQSRLERAKRLLLETDMPSHRVAVGAGFGSVKTFNRVFRRAAGVPPRSFRQNAGT